MKKCHRNLCDASDCFLTVLHESSISFSRGLRDSRKAGRLWGDDETCGRSKEVNTPELIGQRVRVRFTYGEVLREFRKRFLGKRPALFKPGQWHFQPGQWTIHNSILVTDYLTKMGIMTVPQYPYSPYLVPCDFC